MAAPQDFIQPPKKKKRTKNKSKSDAKPDTVHLSAITMNSQQAQPRFINTTAMNNHHFMNMNRINNTMSMSMMGSPYVISPTQQLQMGLPYLACSSPQASSSTPQLGKRING